MGRPLNKRFFGTPTDGGNEIKVQFYNGTASVNGWIVKQLGSKKFRCTDGTATRDCFLVDKDAADVLAEEMTITVDDNGTPRQVTKISGRVVTLDTEVRIPWDFTGTGSVVEMEEAGGAAIAAVNIAGITLGSGVVVAVETATAHGLTTGDTVNFAGIVGTTELNKGLWTVTVVDTTNFTLDGTDGDDFTAYTSGGTVQETTEDDFEGDA
jgi:hypothetical protein